MNNAANDPNNLNNFKIVCPYIKEQRLDRVICTTGSKISFPTIAEVRRWKQQYCCDNWQDCAVVEAWTGDY